MNTNFLIAYHENSETKFQGVRADTKQEALNHFNAVFPYADILAVYKEEA